MTTIDIVVIVSLSILAISILIFVLFLIPILIDLQRLLAIVSKIVSDINGEILPNIKRLSGILGNASKVAANGKQLSSKLFDSVHIIKKGLLAGIATYFASGKKKK